MIAAEIILGALFERMKKLVKIDGTCPGSYDEPASIIATLFP